MRYIRNIRGTLIYDIMGVSSTLSLVTGLVLSFNIGAVMDQIFLRRNERSTSLTIFGWGFYSILSFAFHAVINLVRFVFSHFSRSRRHFRWYTLFQIPDANDFINFQSAVVFYLIEIIVGVWLGFMSNPLLETLIGLNSFILFPLFLSILGWFAILFLGNLPYSNKSQPYKILAYIVTAICVVYIAYQLYLQYQYSTAVNALSNVTALPN
jgi:hypothetical protein